MLPRLLAVWVVAGCLFAACSGRGGGGGSSPRLPIATATPAPTDSLIPVASSGTLTIPLSDPPISGGIALNNVSSIVTSGLTVDLTQATTLPGGFPTLQSAHVQPIFYAETIFSATVSATNGSVTLTVPSSDIFASDSYFVAFFDPNQLNLGWQLTWAGPASVSGDTLTFAHAAAITLDSRTTYAFAMYAVAGAAPTATPTPTPAPSTTPTSGPTASPSPTPSATPTFTPTPTPSPTPTPIAGVLTVTPTDVEITGPSGEQKISVSETNFSGTFTQTNSCGGTSTIATFDTASGTGPSWTPLITGENPGTCSAVIGDGTGQQVSISITVGSNGFTIDTRAHKGR